LYHKNLLFRTSKFAYIKKKLYLCTQIRLHFGLGQDAEEMRYYYILDYAYFDTLVIN